MLELRPDHWYFRRLSFSRGWGDWQKFSRWAKFFCCRIKERTNYLFLGSTVALSRLQLLQIMLLRCTNAFDITVGIRETVEDRIQEFWIGSPCLASAGCIGSPIMSLGLLAY